MIVFLMPSDQAGTNLLAEVEKGCDSSAFLNERQPMDGLSVHRVLSTRERLRILSAPSGGSRYRRHWKRWPPTPARSFFETGSIDG